MRKLMSLLLTVTMLLTTLAVPASARILPEIDKLRLEGKLSNDALHYALIDLNDIKEKGTVIATVYESVYEKKTTNTFTDLTCQTPDSCYTKLTHFIFELTNRYRPQNTDLALRIFRDEQSVGAWVYGQYKDQAMYAIISGIPDCLGHEPYRRPGGGSSSSGGSGSSGSSWINKYSPETIGIDPITSFKITTFSIDKPVYTTSATNYSIDGATADIVDTEIAMDVEPYIKNDRTYVPVRYLAYSLGVAEDGVTWDDRIRKVGITKDDTDIALTIGKTTMLVNSEPVQMDVAPEITNDRTFLPARWAAEALGAEVEWDGESKQTIIKVPVEETSESEEKSGD